MTELEKKIKNKEITIWCCKECEYYTLERPSMCMFDGSISTINYKEYLKLWEEDKDLLHREFKEMKSNKSFLSRLRANKV